MKSLNPLLSLHSSPSSSTSSSSSSSSLSSSSSSLSSSSSTSSSFLSSSSSRSSLSSLSSSSSCSSLSQSLSTIPVGSKCSLSHRPPCSISPKRCMSWICSILTVLCLLCLSSVASGSFVFQIPDQQAFIGKLFYYKMAIPPNVESITFVQAGSGFVDPSNAQQNSLPSWLRFNVKTGELFGAPTERRVYFIQLKAKLTGGSIYEDIFVIETSDPPLYMKNFHSPSRESLECRVEFKQNFNDINDLWQFFSSFKQISSAVADDFKSWLSNFAFQSVYNPLEIGQDLKFSSLKLIYNIERCHQKESTADKNVEHLFLDNKSEKLLSILNELKIESELIKVQRVKEPEFDFSAVPVSSQNHQNHQNSGLNSDGKHSLKKHKRRNAPFAEDPMSTPTLRPTLETSTVDINADFILSRTLIPSMVSPTFTLPSDIAPSTPTYQLSSSLPEINVKERPVFAHYPQLYSTPVLMPEYSLSSSAHTQHIMDKDHHTLLLTPVFGIKSSSVTPINQIETSATSVFLEVLSPTPTLQMPEVKATAMPEGETEKLDDHRDGRKNEDIDNEIDDFLYGSSKSSTTESSFIEESVPSTTSRSNRKPFVNKRIHKMSIDAGKYWQFTIPNDTFMDPEDGDTGKLKLSFFDQRSEQPSADYWIQFDHENQFLYAFPTEDNIGKYKFKLVAIDSSGAEVPADIEIHVRQARNYLQYTHKFIFLNVTWNQELYFEKIQAVSTLFQRMATQVFEDALSSKSGEVLQKSSLLKSISVSRILFDKYSNSWTITWLNNSLPTHPCPEKEINTLFTKLYQLDDPEDAHGFMTPSRELRDALQSPEFEIRKVKREFISKSSCGSLAIHEDSSSSRHKEKIVFRNKLNRLEFKIGQPFRFQIPQDTVYSVTRQVDTRELSLTMAPIEPKHELPDFIYFDVKEQTIYGAPFKSEHVNTFEFKLIAEDPSTGGREQDLFVIDIESDVNTREDYLFESTMNFLIKNINKVPNSQLTLTAKDFYEISETISKKLMGNSNLDAIRLLEINRFPYSRIPDIVDTTFDNNVQADMASSSQNLIEKEEVQYAPKLMKDSSGRKRREEFNQMKMFENEFELEYLPPQHHHHGHHSKHHRSHRAKRALEDNLYSPYFYEVVWTNRSLVTSYHHSSNAYGSEIETITCQNATINEDIYSRLFPASKEEFMKNINMTFENVETVLETYSLLFDKIEANVDLICVEWHPKSVCSVLKPRMLGAKPIKTTEPKEEEGTEKDSGAQPGAGAVTSTPPLSETTPNSDLEFATTQYLGEKLVQLIIPPVAILVALLFAVCIGCCFHRASLRRKAMGNSANIDDEDASLYRQRIPIRFEFERDETAAMLDSSKRNYNVVNYQKQFMGEPSQPMMMKTMQPSSHTAQQRAQQHMQPQQGRNMANYQMLSQNM